MNWIKVEDGLPETKARVHGPEDQVSEEVLVYDEGYGLMIASLEYQNKEKMWWFAKKGDLYDLFLTNVTHWMLLPEPPKENE